MNVFSESRIPSHCSIIFVRYYCASRYAFITYTTSRSGSTTTLNGVVEDKVGDMVVFVGVGDDMLLFAYLGDGQHDFTTTSQSLQRHASTEASTFDREDKITDQTQRKRNNRRV